MAIQQQSQPTTKWRHQGQHHSSHHHPRTMGKGGGVGVLLYSNIKVKPHTLSSFKSFEYTDLHLSASKMNLHLVTIYRPPPSPKKILTLTLFLTEFSSLLEELIIEPSNLLIVRDFKLHVNRPDDTYAAKFLALLDTANLMQHITFPKHKSAHMLDHNHLVR